MEQAIPILRVQDADQAQAWYGRLGFEKEWEHRFEPGFPAFVSMRRGDTRLFLSEHEGDATPGSLVYLRLENVESIAAEFGAEPWGSAEVWLEDPDGNRLPVGWPTS